MKIEKIFSCILSACMIVSLLSCNSENEFIGSAQETIPDVEVSTMDMWVKETRSVSEYLNMPVLHFKDEQVYSETLRQLKNMTENERFTYFQQLGFEGAYILWEQADRELDKIFDMESDDSHLIQEMINTYKDKYSDIFSFNTVDLFDVTPYFTFTDNDLSLLGNIKGYVVIGNSLRGPKYDYPTYDLDEVVSATRAAEPTPIEPGFKGFKDASLTIKNGKYKSTMTIGRIVNGNSFAVEFKTKKKQLFWKKSVKAGYSAMLTMKSSKFNYKNTVFCPYGKEVSILNLPIERVGNVFDAVVENFKSSRGDAKGNQSFHNIRVI